MKFKLYGAKEYWCQLPRIQQGLLGIGQEIVSSNEDIVYANNFPYSSIDKEHKNSAIDNNSKKIFNVLDIPEHIPDFPVDQLKNELSFAHKITCISHAVQKQLLSLGIKAHVIDNPIKEVFFDPAIKKDIDCLYVGRGTDPVKRSHLLEPLFGSMVSVGPFSGFGNHLGLVSDTNLNELYNRSKIVPLPSLFEGLGLTALEAMVCGAVPIVCCDNPNSVLCPQFCICEPTTSSIYAKYNDILANFEKYSKHILLYYSNQIQHRFSKFKIAQNILDIIYKEET